MDADERAAQVMRWILDNPETAKDIDATVTQIAASIRAAVVEENTRLREALLRLTNEAQGFLHLADPMQHGPTNMQVLYQRINEARAALADR